MTADDIRAAKYAEPFEPFTICVRDGRRFPVSDSFHVAPNPTGEMVGIGLPDGSFEFVAMEDISALEIGKTEWVDRVSPTAGGSGS